jgi:glycyl-tRNA synthetase beta chain
VTGDFAAVSAAFKRMKNILSQAGEKGIAAGADVDAALLTEPTEKALAERSAELAGRVASLRAEHRYAAALEQIATLRPQVDAFFDAVMVMDPDAAVRANRLALLEKVLGDFSGIADFSEIVVAG